MYYVRRPEMETAEEKLAFLGCQPMRGLDFDEVQPDKVGELGFNLTNNDFDTLLPLASKETKAAKTAAKERAIFKLFSLGASTNRDEWVVDFDEKALGTRMKWFCTEYGHAAGLAEYPDHLKWSRNLKRRMAQGRNESFDRGLHQVIRTYRPFVRQALYDSPLFVDERGDTSAFFPQRATRNPSICVIAGDRQPFSLVASDVVPNLNLEQFPPTRQSTQRCIGTMKREFVTITSPTGR